MQDKLQQITLDKAISLLITEERGQVKQQTASVLGEDSFKFPLSCLHFLQFH